jgi:hypothetical protein
MNTKHTLNRAYAHWLKDGIFEIGIGILFAGVGTFRASIHFVGEKSATYYWLTAGLFLFMLGYAWGFSRIVKYIKTRNTYPRTGYVSFKPYTYNYKSIVALLILAGVLSFSLGGALGVFSTQLDQQEVGGIVPILMGIVSAIVFTYAAKRVEVKRFYYLAAFSVGSGLMIGKLGVGVVLGLSFFYLSIGLVLVVTGCLALMQFVRSHEAADLNGESQ